MLIYGSSIKDLRDVELIESSLLSDVAKGFARSLRVTGLNLSEYSEQQSESLTCFLEVLADYQVSSYVSNLPVNKVLTYKAIALLKLWVGVVSPSPY